MHCENCAKMEALIERLRHKLSPLEDKELTARLSLALSKIDLSKYKQSLRRGEYIVVTPAVVSDLVFGDPTPTSYKASAIGRSLQAMLWERSSLHGDLIYVMPVSEYEEIKP